MNVLCFTGNIGSDAELKYTGSGTAIASFNAAMKSGFGDKAVTTWVRCSLFGKQAESLTPYLTKGAQVGIVGELSNRKWTDNEGQERYSLEVRVTDVTLLGSKQSASPAEQKPAKRVSHGDELDSDIPF